MTSKVGEDGSGRNMKWVPCLMFLTTPVLNGERVNKDL